MNKFIKICLTLMFASANCFADNQTCRVVSLEPISGMSGAYLFDTFTLHIDGIYRLYQGGLFKLIWVLEEKNENGDHMVILESLTEDKDSTEVPLDFFTSKINVDGKEIPLFSYDEDLSLQENAQKAVSPGDASSSQEVEVEVEVKG